jgi:hypothetical protein
MPGQDLTPDRSQPPIVWIVEEAAAILAGKPGTRKTSAAVALAAHIAATGRRTGIVVTRSKARPVVVVDDHSADLPDLTHLPARDSETWTRVVGEQAAVLADRARRAPGDGAVSD